MKIGLWRPGLADTPESIVQAQRGLSGGLSIISWYQAFSAETSVLRLKNCWAANVTPMVTLEPWEPGNPGNRNYSLKRIASGLCDPYLKSVARAMQQPTWLRFGHEFNGSWYPWSGDPTTWKRAFERVRAIMPSHVSMVWSPNVVYPGSSLLSQYWTPAADVIAIDGYAWKGERTEQVFAMTISTVQQYDRPVWVGETACARTDQARWIGSLRNLPLQGVVWFDERKEEDWRLTRAGTQAFASLARGH